MRINFTNPISFKQLPVKKDDNNIRLPEDFKFKTPDGQEYTYSVQSDGYYYTGSDWLRYKCEVTDKENKPVGTDYIAFSSGDKVLTEYDLQVREDKQNINGIGSTLKLCQIIEMLENGLNETTTVSTPEALMFHLRFKYDIDAPPGGKKWSIEDILSLISKKEHPLLKNIAKEAETLLFNDHLPDCDFIEQGQIVIEKYVDEVVKNKIPKAASKLDADFSATLTLPRSKVLKNKAFYNELFKKYGIDYTIA